MLNDPVKHALVAIQALERGQRAAVVAELAVVIVLDDPGPLLTAPVQQGQTPWQRQRDTERALMGRRHHGKTRIGRPAQPASTHRPSSSTGTDTSRIPACSSTRRA